VGVRLTRIVGHIGAVHVVDTRETRIKAGDAPKRPFSA
jgi:hypothetical protein